MVDRAEARILERAGLAQLLEGLRADHFRLIGPTVRDGAIAYDEIESLGDLPAGWTDEQGPGRYRLSQSGDGALFGYNVGPQSWKRLLFPPRRGSGELSARDVTDDSHAVTPSRLTAHSVARPSKGRRQGFSVPS